MTARISDKNSREDIEKLLILYKDDSMITIKNISRLFHELGEAMKDEELVEVIDCADFNEYAAIDSWLLLQHNDQKT